MYQINRYFLRALDVLKQEGTGVLLHRINIAVHRLFGRPCFGNFDHGYANWRMKYAQPLSPALSQQLLEVFEYKPIISIIVPIYKVDVTWLDKAIQSVLNQSYPHWQLCLIDDASEDRQITRLLDELSDDRIFVHANDVNQGISSSSNIGIKMATGEFIALLDHDDELDQDALLENVRCLNRDKSLDLIYSDEDKISSQGKLHTPFFKPDYSPQLLTGQNYFSHFLVVRTTLLRKVNGFNSDYNGAQDYDLVLRLTRETRKIAHLPKVLYHWREIPQSTSSSFNSKSYAHVAGLQALQQHLNSKGLIGVVTDGKAPGTYRVNYDIAQQPLISIIVPYKDQIELLDKCLASIFKNTRWNNLEVLLIDNNSENIDTQKRVDHWTQSESRLSRVEYKHAFNFSAICNFAVARAKGEYIVLLNSDVEIISVNWIETLIGLAQQPDIGAVGCKLLYADHTIQHAGIVLGIDNGAGHPFKNFPNHHMGYFQRLGLTHNVSAVTAAMLMVSKRKYNEVGGLNEADFAVAYNDVDFCLSLQQQGYFNVIEPNISAYHHESRSRGYDDQGEKLQRQEKEKQALRKKWQAIFDQGDPFYNQNLTLKREDYSLRS